MNAKTPEELQAISEFYGALDAPIETPSAQEQHYNYVSIIEPTTQAGQHLRGRGAPPVNFKVSQEFLKHAANTAGQLEEIITPLNATCAKGIAIQGETKAIEVLSTNGITIRHTELNAGNPDHITTIASIKSLAVELFSPFQKMANDIFSRPDDLLEFTFTLGSPIITRPHCHGYPTINLPPQENADPTLLTNGSKYHRNLPAYIPAGTEHQAPALRPIIAIQPASRYKYDLDI